MSDPTDLAAWLDAQIDEDEQWANEEDPGGMCDGGVHLSRDRMLREVEAKRRIMAIHHPSHYASYAPRVCDGCGYRGDCDDPVTEDINECPELRILAAVYADRPGYDAQRWAP